MKSICQRNPLLLLTFYRSFHKGHVRQQSIITEPAYYNSKYLFLWYISKMLQKVWKWSSTVSTGGLALIGQKNVHLYVTYNRYRSFIFIPILGINVEVDLTSADYARMMVYIYVLFMFWKWYIPEGTTRRAVLIFETRRLPQVSGVKASRTYFWPRFTRRWVDFSHLPNKLRTLNLAQPDVWHSFSYYNIISQRTPRSQRRATQLQSHFWRTALHNLCKSLSLIWTHCFQITLSFVFISRINK